MKAMSPRAMILIGLVLVVIGFALSFLMFGHWLKPSFLLGFLAYGSSVVGLVLGMVGATYTYISIQRE